MGNWSQAFQSLLEKDLWLQSYTDQTLVQLAAMGIKRVFDATSGFTVDCLETIDEIGFEARELFEQAAVQLLHQCRCLYDHPKWIEAMRALVVQEGQGWL